MLGSGGEGTQGKDDGLASEARETMKHGHFDDEGEEVVDDRVKELVGCQRCTRVRPGFLIGRG